MKDLNRLKLLPILIVSLTLSKIIWKKFAHKKIYAETSLHWLGEGPKICPWRAANLAAMILWLETPCPYRTIHMNNVWDGGDGSRGKSVKERWEFAKSENYLAQHILSKYSSKQMTQYLIVLAL